jgi:protein TonB
MLVVLPGFAVNPRPLQAHILDVVVQRESMLPVSTKTSTGIPVTPLSRNISAITKTRHIAEPGRKPEAEPAGPAVTAAAARDSVPVEAASAKQDEARSSMPPSTGITAGITAGVTGTVCDVAAVTPTVVNAGYLRNPLPPYPLVARRNGEQGTVILRVRVTREGMPASVDIEKTSRSSRLDDAARETVRTWRFFPARQNGQPVEAWVLVPVVFKLEGTS